MSMVLESAPRQIIPRLVHEAKEFEKRERRSDVRYPFVRHASIGLNDQTYSVYTRNISDSGIGLMHTMELPLCEVELTIPTELGRFLRVHARVEWCEPSSDGLYVSGLMFI